MRDEPRHASDDASDLPALESRDIETIIGTCLTVCQSDDGAMQDFALTAGPGALAELSADIAAARGYFLALADIARLAALRVTDAQAALARN